MPDNLPAVPDDGQLEPMIFDGEIVSETTDTAAAVRSVTLSPHARAAVRHGMYVAAGAVVAGRRWHLARTRHERMQRAAEAAGDHEAALKWAQHHALVQQHRRAHRVAMLEAFVNVAKASPWIIGGGLGSMGTLGVFMAIGERRVTAVASPFIWTAHAVMLGTEVASAVWSAAAIAVPVTVVAVLWHLGRTAGDFAPRWAVAAKPDGEDGGMVVTADTIVLALQNLDRIPALKKAFKEGWQPTFHLLPVKDGRGYSAVFSVPLGVTAEMVADQNPVFARNLHRAEVEVWPTDAEKAGTGPAGSVAVWIADSGVLSKAAPEYPLLHEGTADVFTGVPGGVTPRGDGTLIPVVGNNAVFGGQMGQGKSNACRVVMLGCSLDPLPELDVFVFANNGDFDAYRPRLARYHKGVEDDTVAAAVNRLHELYAEVGRREARLAELGAKKVTRGLAEAHPDMRPIITLFSECHELFGHPDYGDIAAELATKTVKRARKTAITLLFDTQSSRKEAIPPKLVELVSVNVCFYVKTWRSNDGFLGDGSFAAGIRATELRPGRDRGTSLITGVSEAQFELLRWYFVEVNDDTGFDAAAEVIARAVARVAPGTAIEATEPLTAIEVRDLLGDLDEVLGQERTRLRDAIGLLRTLAPTWGAYRNLTAKQLEEDLDGEGVRVINTSGTKWLDPADLRQVLAQRESE